MPFLTIKAMQDQGEGFILIKHIIKHITKERWTYIFLAPWLILFLVFVLYPFILGLGIALTEYDFANIRFNFIDNYKEIFQQKLYLNAVFTSFKMTVFIVPCIILISLWISNMLIGMKRHTQAFVKASLYIPGTVSSVALVITWKWIFNPAYGLSNYLCSIIGIPPINWYGQQIYAMFLIIILVVFILIGSDIILYSAAMLGIPVYYYESIKIDGAKKLQEFLYITMPLVKPTTLYVSITTTISAFQIFEIPLLLTAGGPSYGTTTVMLLIYKSAFEYGKFGLAAAMGVIVFLIIAGVSSLQIKFLSSNVQY